MGANESVPRRPVELLVTGEAGSLPDRTSTQRYFSLYGDVDHVKETDEGLLVMFDLRLWPFCGAVTALHDTHHEVGGHRVVFHLLCPDVYGCDVTVTRHRVSVTVGHEVIRRITQDETYKQFSQAGTNRQLTFRELVVSFLPNQIDVQSPNSGNTRVSGWEWELHVLEQIIAFLKPFKDLLPQTIKHTSYRERNMNQKCRKGTSQSKDVDTNDGETIAVFQFTHEGKLQVAARGDTLKQLRQSYPTIDISCDTGMETLTLRGPARAVYQAREDMCSLVKNLITELIELDPWKIKVLDNPDARKRIQRTLDQNNILCIWDIAKFRGFDGLINVTVLQKDQSRVNQVFNSSFQTLKIPFDENLKSSLQSDAWKVCLEGLQTSKEGEPAPVVNVGINDIIICGFTVSVESARRAVLEFFHNNVVQTYPQLFGQEVQEVITGLKPWQMKLLANTDLKERIVAELPDVTRLNVRSDSLVIKAPLRVLTESVSLFWRFVASLSQRKIHLTTALVEMYKQPAARSKVQTLLKAAGLPCQWEVEDGHITVSAEDTDQERLKQIFTSTFSEVHIPVSPLQSNLLRSEDVQALIADLQERKSGSPTPVIKISPGDNCMIIVDVYERCDTVQRAIQKFFDDYEVIPDLQKKGQERCPQQDNIAAKTEIEEIQTETNNLRSTEQQTDNRQLESKEQQTQDNSVITVEQEQQTERPILTENGFQTDKITTREQQLQTDHSQLESTGQQTDDSKKATNDTRLQTGRGNVQVKEVHTEEKQQQTEVKHSQSTAQQTENKQLKNEELQTDDSRGVTVETQTKGATFTERGFQTEHLKTVEKQLQTDPRESNSKQQQTESKATENKETQSASNATTTTENPTQTEGQRTEGQTEESNTRARAQGADCELIENLGTATRVPESLDNAGPSSQTEWKRTNELVLPVNPFQVQMVQTRNVQFLTHHCPVEVPRSNPSSVHADFDTNTCVDEIQAEEATSDDHSQTFPKRIIESEQGQGTPPQDHATPSGDIVQQRLLCLTVEQLLQVATHLDIGRQTLDQLQSRCPAPDDLKRRLTETCRAASDTETLFVAVLRMCARPAVTGSSENSISHHNSQTAVTGSSDNSSSHHNSQTAVTGSSDNSSSHHNSQTAVTGSSDNSSSHHNSQAAPMTAADAEHLPATISVESGDEISVHSQCYHLASGAQLPSNVSTETQETAQESFAQSDTETGYLIQPQLCNPQPLNSVDQVDLLHFTQADPCLFSGMSTTCDLQGSGSSTTSGQYTPVLASMLLSSSASSGPLSPGTSQQQVKRPAHAARSAQRSSPVDHPQTQDRSNIVTSERHTVDIHSRVRVGPTIRPVEDDSLHAAQPPVVDRDSWVHINQRLQQLEDTMTRQSQDPQPPVQRNERRARPETQMRQRLLQMEIQMQDRLEHLIQHRLQSAGTAESRVYLNQIRALQIEMHAHMESQISHLRTQMHGALDDFRREMTMNVHGAIVVDNASSSSSHSAPRSEVSD